jgi:hypothetical protein
VTGRQAPSAARFGHFIGVLVNAALLWAVNVRPGWDAVPFLTDDTPQVLALVNTSLAAGIVMNLVYMLHDGRRTQALGGVITSSVGLAATVKILQVFPFDLDQPYVSLTKALLLLAVVGAAIGIIANLVSLFNPRSSARSPVGVGK